MDKLRGLNVRFECVLCAHRMAGKSWEADIAFAPLGGQHPLMKIAANPWMPLVGLGILLGGPIAFSYPFLLTWNGSGINGNPFSAWLFVDLFVALAVGCLGFVFLRFRLSTKALMLLF